MAAASCVCVGRSRRRSGQSFPVYGEGGECQHTQRSGRLRARLALPHPTSEHPATGVNKEKPLRSCNDRGLVGRRSEPLHAEKDLPAQFTWRRLLSTAQLLTIRGLCPPNVNLKILPFVLALSLPWDTRNFDLEQYATGIDLFASQALNVQTPEVTRHVFWTEIDRCPNTI